ncbi:hypothetical protein ALC53_08520 [Atta colombica]|uniref:Uncharacterized protein n=1 Tax=Atta colombica TaxID=520822 RepID=A0A195BAC2_9HYME|nr:hypothetical protein ALC53_08520 [Atta colombica]
MTLDVKITVLEALKPLTTRSFTNSSLTINTNRLMFHARSSERVPTILEPSFVFSSTFHQLREWFSIKKLRLVKETKTRKERRSGGWMWKRRRETSSSRTSG